MASLVQAASAYQGASPGVSTFASPPTIGNKIFVCVATWDSTAALCTVTDNKGNTWTRRASRTATNAGAEIWSTTVTATGSGFAVTATLSGADASVQALEYTSDVSTTLDQTANFRTVTSSGNTATTPTLSQASELAIVVGAHGYPTMSAPTSGWTSRTLQTNGTANEALVVSDQFTAATTGVSATFSGYTGDGTTELIGLIGTFPITGGSNPSFTGSGTASGAENAAGTVAGSAPTSGATNAAALSTGAAAVSGSFRAAALYAGTASASGGPTAAGGTSGSGTASGAEIGAGSFAGTASASGAWAPAGSSVFNGSGTASGAENAAGAFAGNATASGSFAFTQTLAFNGTGTASGTFRNASSGGTKTENYSGSAKRQRLQMQAELREERAKHDAATPQTADFVLGMLGQPGGDDEALAILLLLAA